MAEPQTTNGPSQTGARPFPWFCPKCRRQEVRRATIPYQCQRVYNGQSINVVLAALAVPRCEHCGELVFDYDAEEQIERAYRLQIDAAANGGQTATTTTASNPPTS